MTTKAQAIYNFWASFGLPAYEENSVPDEATLPYITYEYASDSIGSEVLLTASIWERSTSWTYLNTLEEQISERLAGSKTLKCDGGGIILWRGTPFAQRMSDETSKDVKRILLQVRAEFITLY